jgi:hypothetical protein
MTKLLCGARQMNFIEMEAHTNMLFFRMDLHGLCFLQISLIVDIMEMGLCLTTPLQAYSQKIPRRYIIF